MGTTYAYASGTAKEIQRQTRKFIEIGIKKENIFADKEKPCVYFISDGLGHIKIGKARELNQRLKILQTSNPMKLKVLARIEVNSEKDASGIESKLHECFEEYRLNGEWFIEAPILEFLEQWIRTQEI